MHVSTLQWIVTIVGLAALLLLDLAVVVRRPREPSMAESAAWVGFYVAIAVAFGVGINLVYGGRYAAEFFAGWLTEYSLSADNLFVFMIIMARFAVPRVHQTKMLFLGIVVALVMRGAFIAAGAAVVNRFSWIFYLFGAFLIYTAVTVLRQGDDEPEFRESALIRWSRRVLPISAQPDGGRLTTRVEGRRMFTPLVAVMIAIGTTDLIFALDSIPAIFGLTREPYLIFTVNVLALMGLRQLYFLLGGLLDRITYLSVGLAVVLAFIGVKMVLEALADNKLPFVAGGRPLTWVPHVPTWLSLTVIVGVLATTTVVSLLKSERPARPADRV